MLLMNLLAISHNVGNTIQKCFWKKNFTIQRRRLFGMESSFVVTMATSIFTFLSIVFQLGLFKLIRTRRFGNVQIGKPTNSAATTYQKMMISVGMKNIYLRRFYNQNWSLFHTVESWLQQRTDLKNQEILRSNTQNFRSHLTIQKIMVVEDHY